MTTIEVKPIKKLNAIVNVPGSKYIANRIVTLAALAEGISEISNVPNNDDINNLIKALQRVGVNIKQNNDKTVIYGTTGKLEPTTCIISVGDSGTLLRFITSIAGLADKTIVITGSKRIKERPIGELLTSLNHLGIKAISLNKENNNCPPLEIKGGTLTGGKTKLRGDISSQFISSLLIIAPFAKNNVEIEVTTQLVSEEYVEMTIEAMKLFGVEVDKIKNKSKNNSYRIKTGQKYKAIKYTIPSDWSSASYFMGAAAITQGKITISNVDYTMPQGEALFADCLKEMGCNIIKEKHQQQITVEGCKQLKAITKDMNNMPDVVQTLAAVAVFAEGTTTITNIKQLHDKECDRIEDTAAELRKVGIEVTARTDSISITGNKKVSGAMLESHNDHRMAMSLALLGLKMQGIKINGAEAAAKSFPEFWKKLEEIGVEVKYE